MRSVELGAIDDLACAGAEFFDVWKLAGNQTADFRRSAYKGADTFYRASVAA